MKLGLCDLFLGALNLGLYTKTDAWYNLLLGVALISVGTVLVVLRED